MGGGSTISRARILLLLVLALLAGPALAATGPVEPAAPCVAQAAPAISGAAVWAAGRFDCSGASRHQPGQTSWSRYTGFALASDPADPWVLRHAFVREGATQVWFAYADGAVIPAAPPPFDGRQPLGPADLVYPVPVRDAALTGVLIGLEQVQGRYASPQRLALNRASAYAAESGHYTLFWGVLGGLMGAMLLYNLLLFAVMRQLFQLLHCGFTASILLFAVSWSGAVLYVVPGLSLFAHIHLNHLAIALCFVAAPAFYMSFLEPGTLPRAFRRGHLALCAVPLIAAVLQLFGPQRYWLALEATLFSVALIAMGLLLVAIVFAIRRKSRAIRMLLLAWTATYVMVTLCALHALGIYRIDGAWFDLFPFVATAFETTVTAFAIAHRLLGLRRERDRAKGREQAFKALAETDPLTGLRNRRAFLEAVIGRAGPISLLVVDIDHFKTINDRHGHHRGDELLVTVARTLEGVAPPEAVVGRLGGEEFAIACPTAAPVDLAERARRAIALQSFAIDLPVTASIGVATGTVGDERGWTDLYIAADEALYRAKRVGRDRVVSTAPRLAAAG